MDVNPTKLVAYGLFIRLISDLFSNNILIFLIWCWHYKFNSSNQETKNTTFFVVSSLAWNYVLNWQKLGFTIWLNQLCFSILAIYIFYCALSPCCWDIWCSFELSFENARWKSKVSFFTMNILSWVFETMIWLTEPVEFILYSFILVFFFHCVLMNPCCWVIWCSFELGFENAKWTSEFCFFQ